MKSIYHNTPVFSQLFLVAAGMCFILNIFSHGIVYSVFSLTATDITQKFEFWRLISYPLSTFSIESFLLLTITVGLFSSVLEITFSTKRFVTSIFLLVLSQGLLYTFAFTHSAKPVVLSGGDCISFFVMALFTFVLPSRSISIWRGLEVRGLYLVLVISIFSFCLSGWRALHDASEVFYFGAISSAFGVVFAVVLTSIVHHKLKRIRRLSISQLADAADERYLEQEEELVSSFGKIDRNISKNYYQDSHRSDEEVLNQILDKIFESGQESLTHEEKTFLEDYSHRMR